MKQVRFHGRGGQGAVTAATLLAMAAFEDGKYTSAFPKFGVERRGAPVLAFTRISDKFIRTKEQIYHPDILVVLDSTLLEVVNVTEGLVEGGEIILNTEKTPEELGLGHYKVRTIDVTKLALEILGRDIVNTAMLGAFAAFTGEVSLSSLQHAIEEHFPPSLAEKNQKLVEQVYNEAKKRQ